MIEFKIWLKQIEPEERKFNVSLIKFSDQKVTRRSRSIYKWALWGET